MKNISERSVLSNLHMICKIEKYDILLSKPFKYFLDTLISLPYSKISITDTHGICGQGEIVHAIDANGETQGGVRFFEPIINFVLADYETVSSLSDIQKVMKSFRLNIIHNTGLMCGVEQALFDILSQKTGMTLTKILGGLDNKQIFIQTTIPMQDDFILYKEGIDNIVNNYHPHFIKFKVGINLTLESKVIHYLRELDGNVNISIDANQAFPSYNKALNFLNLIKDANVSWAEQLLAKDDISGMKSLRQNTNMPLMADESLHTPLEAEYFCQNNLVDYFNIKLAKTGGILKALEIINIANQYGKNVMLGSMLHGKLGIKYNLGFALSQNFITNDFFSYFNVLQTRELNYIKKDLSVSKESLYG